MRNRTLTILLLFVFAIASQSCDTKLNVDNPNDFYKYIGEDGSQWGIDLVTDLDGNIYILGKTESLLVGKQIYVVKTDPRGNVLWKSTLGDRGDEEPKDIEMIAGGDLVLVSDWTDPSGQKGFAIYKVNKTDGAMIGTPVYSEMLSGTEYHVNSITQTTDGFIVAAYIEHGDYKSGLVFRYDNALLLFPPSWDASFSLLTSSGGLSTGYDFVPIKVMQFDDNTFYTFGYTNTLNGDGIKDNNFFVYRGGEFNGPLGGLLIIDGPDVNSDERLTSVKRMAPESGAGYVLTGYISYPGTGQQDLYVAKTPLALTQATDDDQTTFVIGTPKVVTTNLSSISASTASVYSSTGSGFLLLAEENSSGNGNIYLTKVDKNLVDAWSDPHRSQVFGGVGNDLAGAVAETSNQRILVVGSMTVGEVNGQSKIVLMNLSPNGMFGE
jgi:hypothetical protein